MSNENGTIKDLKTVIKDFFLRIPCFPSIVFYGKILRIVFTGSFKAKRGQYDTAAWCESSLATIDALKAVGGQVEITGTEHFKKFEGPCVFIANHMSALETFVLPHIIAPFKPVTFVIKQSLIEYPVFKHIMRSRDPITVGRSNPRDDLKAVLAGGAERLKRGVSVIVFPQTTRSEVFDPKTFNTIGVKLAKKAGVPVVPIALKTDVLRPQGKFLKEFGAVDPSKKAYFAFGEPLRVQGRGDEEQSKIIAFILSKQKEWKERGNKSL